MIETLKVIVEHSREFKALLRQGAGQLTQIRTHRAGPERNHISHNTKCMTNMGTLGVMGLDS